MPGNEGLTYNDTEHGTDAVSRYAAFLALQARAYTMTDQEYMSHLDAIIQAGGVPDGDGKYAYGDADDTDGISQAVIEAIQSDDDTVPAEKRVLQFEQYGGSFAHQMGQDDPPDTGGQPDASPDPTLEIRFDESGQPVLDSDGVPAGSDAPGDGYAVRLDDGTVVPASSDPTLEIRFDESGQPAAAMDGVLPSGSEPEEQDGDDPEQAGVYKHIEPEESEPEKTDDEPQVPAASYPEGQWPGTVGATTLDLEDEDEKQAVYGGGLHVTESFQIHDWLDELGAGTGLLKGVQTAEYIPPAVQPAATGGLVKTPLMQKLDRKIEYTYGTGEQQKQPGIDGPNV